MHPMKTRVRYCARQRSMSAHARLNSGADEDGDEERGWFNLGQQPAAENIDNDKQRFGEKPTPSVMCWGVVWRGVAWGGSQANLGQKLRADSQVTPGKSGKAQAERRANRVRAQVLAHSQRAHRRHHPAKPLALLSLNK